jgi:hypothetical protein
MRRVVLSPGAESSATRVSLTALMEHVHSDAAILPGRKFFLLMLIKLTSLSFATLGKAGLMSMGSTPVMWLFVHAA